MSEIAKCPCCGESVSEFPDSGFYECDNCPFMCALKDFDSISAAMELTKLMTSKSVCLSADEETSAAFAHAMGVFNG